MAKFHAGLALPWIYCCRVPILSPIHINLDLQRLAEPLRPYLPFLFPSTRPSIPWSRSPSSGSARAAPATPKTPASSRQQLLPWYQLTQLWSHSRVTSTHSLPPDLEILNLELKVDENDRDGGWDGNCKPSVNREQ